MEGELCDPDFISFVNKIKKKQINVMAGKQKEKIPSKLRFFSCPV